ncbi:MAG TPA: TlpA disulfide reductase family protein [Paucimonas sp.]|nr:TlpA disulfide reductase family protein [Paucimonas sp.]
MKRNILLITPVALLFMAIGIYFGNQRVAPTPAEPTAASLLLAQTLPDSAGKAQSLSQWKDRPLVVNFWATWCAPCVEEMPELSGLQAEVAARHIQIIGIGIDSPSNIAEFSQKYKIGYPLYVAGMSGNELSKRLGNQAGGLPFTVLIGSDGQVKQTYLGRLKFEELRRDLATLH